MRHIVQKRPENSWHGTGIEDQVQRKRDRHHPLSEVDKARNRRIAVIRSGGERPLATSKQHYDLGRTRFMGLAKNITNLILTLKMNFKSALDLWAWQKTSLFTALRRLFVKERSFCVFTACLHMYPAG